MLDKKKRSKGSDKEKKFIRLLLLMITQFAECSQNEAIFFVTDLIDKMDKEKIKIK